MFDVRQEEPSKYARGELLLDHMRRRSDSDFAKFRMALEKHNQAHVINNHLPAQVAVAAENKTLISVPTNDSDSKIACEKTEESKPVVVTSGTPFGSFFSSDV